jgi:TolB-like protein
MRGPVGRRHPAVRRADEVGHPERNQQVIDRLPRLRQRYGRSQRGAIIRQREEGVTHCNRRRRTFRWAMLSNLGQPAPAQLPHSDGLEPGSLATAPLRPPWKALRLRLWWGRGYGTLTEPLPIVRDQVRDRLDFAFEDMGEQQVKNIVRPVRVYTLTPEARGRSSTPVAGPVSQSAGAPRLSIVILPFANLSSDPEQEYFADAVTDDLTTDLTRITDSFVISRNTAFTYKGKAVNVKQIGKELGVRYALEGSVRRVGQQVRANVQLIDTETGAHVWADRLETDRADLAKAQDEIVSRLARRLQLEIVEAATRRIELEKPVNPDASDFVMRGWAWSYRPNTTASLQEAQGAFERAPEIDPQSIDAKIGLAWTVTEYVAEGRSHVVNGVSISREQDMARADQLLLEALERDRVRAPPAASESVDRIQD